MLASESDKKIIEQTLNESMKENHLCGKRIAIFGCTLYARDIRDSLLNRGVSVDAFIDNNPDKVGRKCLGLSVFLPGDYLAPYDENIVVIICSKYYHEMKMQVMEFGYGEDNILNIPIQECFSSSTASREREFEQARRQVEEGYEIYCTLAKGQEESLQVLVCPYPGTGDIYMACSLLETYLRRENINNYLVTVIGNNCVKVAKLFGIQNIRNITNEEMTKLLKAWEFLGTERMHIKPLLYWGWRTKRYLYADKYKQITFNEMFQYDVFNFPHLMRRRLILSNKDSKYSEKLFKKLRLKKGRTVILAPYAGSFVSEISLELWTRVAHMLTEKGYSVCTNCNGESESEIQGTVPVFFPYENAIDVLEYAGGFIAIRSGFCDIVSSASCKMAIIYENGFNAANYNFFSVKKMGLNPHVQEWIYDSDDESFMNKVMHLF